MPLPRRISGKEMEVRTFDELLVDGYETEARTFNGPLVGVSIGWCKSRLSAGGDGE